MRPLRIMGVKGLVALLIVVFAVPAFAQTFPPLTGRVVDAARILSAEQVAALDAKLQAVEVSSGHQLVVATVPSLQDYPIEDYGYRLLRHWGIGQKDVNDGVILLVAPTERKVRIEVGYGLEPVLTDAYSGIIINTRIVPHFKANDFPAGISAGVDAIAEQIKLPPEQAQARVAAAAAARAENTQRGAPGFSIGTILPILFFLLFIVLPLLRRGGGGRRYKGGSGIGQVILWSALDAAMRGGRGGGSSWGGGGGFGGGGGGGFSGGGGSSGGGGASGGW